MKSTLWIFLVRVGIRSRDDHHRVARFRHAGRNYVAVSPRGDTEERIRPPLGRNRLEVSLRGYTEGRIRPPLGRNCLEVSLRDDTEERIRAPLGRNYLAVSLRTEKASDGHVTETSQSATGWAPSSAPFSARRPDRSKLRPNKSEHLARAVNV